MPTTSLCYSTTFPDVYTAALFFDQMDKIPKLCTLKFLPNPPSFPQIFPVAPSEYLLNTHEPSFQTLCHSTNIKTHSGCQFCHVTIP